MLKFGESAIYEQKVNLKKMKKKNQFIFLLVFPHNSCLKNIVLLYGMFIHASNKCKWLKYRKNEFCNKNCVGMYCALHNSQIKQGMRTSPCRMCGIGLSHDGICMKCYGTYSYRKMLRTKKLNMKNLVDEIKQKVRLIE